MTIFIQAYLQMGLDNVSICKLENGPQIRFEQYLKADDKYSFKILSKNPTQKLNHKLKHCHVSFVDRYTYVII